MDSRRIKSIFLGVMAIWSSAAQSAVGTHYGSIDALLSDNKNYGFCMIKVKWESSIDCPNNGFQWIARVVTPQKKILVGYGMWLSWRRLQTQIFT